MKPVFQQMPFHVRGWVPQNGAPRGVLGHAEELSEGALRQVGLASARQVFPPDGRRFGAGTGETKPDAPWIPGHKKLDPLTLSVGDATHPSTFKLEGTLKVVYYGLLQERNPSKWVDSFYFSFNHRRGPPKGDTLLFGNCRYCERLIAYLQCSGKLISVPTCEIDYA